MTITVTQPIHGVPMTESQTNEDNEPRVIGVSMSDWEGADNLSDDEVNELEETTAIRQGSIIAGKSGARKRLLGELMQPQVIGVRYCASSSRQPVLATTTPRKRPNRRYIGAGVYLPSGISEKVDELVIAVDTSGSIPDADLAVFLSEVQSICTTVKPTRFAYCTGSMRLWVTSHTSPTR